MSFAAEHYFWQQRVDREIGARNKFIENNFLKNKSEIGLNYGPDGKITMNGSFNLYEVGLSDPNQLRPREFKYHKTNVPLDFSNTTYEKLAKLTSTGSTFEGLVQKKTPLNEYTGYQQKSQGSRALSHVSSKRKSFALIAAQNLANNHGQQQQQQQQNQYQNNQEQRTYDGKRKRQRFNEEFDDTISRNSTIQHAKSAMSQHRLTQGSLNSFNNNGGRLAGGEKSMLTGDKQSGITKNTQLKSLVSIQKSYLRKQQDAKTDSSSQFRAKVQGMVNTLDDKQLERLSHELGANDNKTDILTQDEQGDDPDHQAELQDVVVDLKNHDRNPHNQHQEDQLSMNDIKSVTTDIKSQIGSQHGGAMSTKSYKSSNYSAINKLSQQLDEERKEREKMQQEIEELKKMNSDLCNAILNTKESPSKKQ
eukprot:403343518